MSSHNALEHFGTQALANDYSTTHKIECCICMCTESAGNPVPGSAGGIAVCTDQLLGTSAGFLHAFRSFRPLALASRKSANPSNVCTHIILPIMIYAKLCNGQILHPKATQKVAERLPTMQGPSRKSTLLQCAARLGDRSR
jgi:hypothetical protein